MFNAGLSSPVVPPCVASREVVICQSILSDPVDEADYRAPAPESTTLFSAGDRSRWSGVIAVRGNDYPPHVSTS